MVTVPSHRRQAAIPSRSRDLDPRRVDCSFVTPSGCGCHCATPFLRRVRCRSGSQTKEQRFLPYCFLFSFFCVYFHATHFIASPRSAVVGRLPETVKHLTGSPWPLGMGLRSGLTAYSKEEFEAFVFLDGFLEAVSSVYTRVLAGLSVLPDHGRLELPKRP